MISVGGLLYFVIRTLPRIEPEVGAPDAKGFLERLIVSRIPERVDGAVNSFLFKFLRKLKVVLLKIDNVVGRQIKRIQPEAAGNIRTSLIIGGALIEALTIYALLVGILLWLKLPDVGALKDLMPK